MKMLYFWKIYFFEKFLIFQVRCMVDKTQNHFTYYILNMRKMRASDKSIPSCTHAETLKFVVMIVLEMVCK